MSKCPKCSQDELIWDKTKNGKNWLKDQNGNWHTCSTPTKPIEVSSSPPPKQEHDWGDWDYTSNGRKGFYKCKKCPEQMGIFNRYDQYFQDDLKVHNSIFHSFGEDYSKMRIGEMMESQKNENL